MTRMVPNKATGPMKIEPADFPRDEQGNLKPLWICACGLSQKLPICDGAHKACKTTEPEGFLHVYDESRTRIVESRPQG